jgi:hypothetical protein
MIVGAGLFVFLREQHKAKLLAKGAARRVEG